MQTKYFVLATAMVCAVSMAANNKVTGSLQATRSRVVVSGVIKDAADKTALIGVNVSLKQGDQQVSGTVTDAHGKFSLEAETGEFVLECSYNGLTDMCNYRSTFFDTFKPIGTFVRHECNQFHIISGQFGIGHAIQASHLMLQCEQNALHRPRELFVIEVIDESNNMFVRAETMTAFPCIIGGMRDIQTPCNLLLRHPFALTCLQ